MSEVSTAYFDAVVAHYVACALWSSTDITSDDDDTGGEPLDAAYGPDDLAPEAARAAREDCADFLEQATPIILRLGLTPESVGHNFWLTRNRHGAGFWDLGLGADGEALTQISKAAGSRDLYVGDDGKIYQA